MTTECTKPVRRKMNHTERYRGKQRPMIVSIHPGGYIGLRLEGTRQMETIPIGAVYYVAIKMRCAKERADKAKAKKDKAKAR